MFSGYEIPNDPSLPHLSTALDEMEMANRFQKLLFIAEPHSKNAARVRHWVKRCQIERVKYKAGQKCLVNYLLQIQDVQTRQICQQRLSTRLFPEGESRLRFQKAQSEPLVMPPFGQAVMHLPELEMVIWSFPNDRKIGSVNSLMTLPPNQVALVKQAICDRLNAQIVNIERPELVHYVPEHTCTVRLQMTLQPLRQAAGQTRSITLFGKAYYNDEGAESWRLMQMLWESPVCQQGQLHIAQPIAYAPNERILWQMGLTGRTLLSFALDSAEFTHLLINAARSVAHLHATQLPCKRTSQLVDWLETLSHMQILLANVRPDLNERVAILVEQLVHRANELDGAPSATLHGAPSATLHGDLHLQNLFVERAGQLVPNDVTSGDPVPTERIALIDLDNLSTGSPWRDLGSLFAGLYYRALVDDVEATYVANLMDRFCAEYAQYTPWPLDRPAIDWYTATALLGERVYRSLTRIKRARPAMVDELVARAEKLDIRQILTEAIQ